MAIIAPSVRNNDCERLHSPRGFAGGPSQRSESVYSATKESATDTLDRQKSDPYALLAILVGLLVALFLLLPSAHATSWPPPEKIPATSCFAPAPHPDK